MGVRGLGVRRREGEGSNAVLMAKELPLLVPLLHNSRHRIISSRGLLVEADEDCSTPFVESPFWQTAFGTV